MITGIAILLLLIVCVGFLKWLEGERPRPMVVCPNVTIMPGAFVVYKNGYNKGLFKHGPLMVDMIKQVSQQHSDGQSLVQWCSLKGESFQPLLEDLVAVIPGDCILHRFIDYEVNDLNDTNPRCIHCGMYASKIQQLSKVPLHFKSETEIDITQTVIPIGIIYRLIH